MSQNNIQPAVSHFIVLKRFKDKGAFLILVWSFLITGGFNFYMEQNEGLVFDIQLIIGALMCYRLLDGWLTYTLDATE